MRNSVVILAFCLALGPAGWTTGQAQTLSRDAEPDVPEKAGKDMKAVRVTGASPRIDGRLDEDAWKDAAGIDDFVQMEPQNMGATTERTVVLVVYDARYLYVGIRCYAQNPRSIRSGLGRRDNIPETDRVQIQFDPRHDHQTGYVYQVNASGVQGDFTIYNDTLFSFDYDGVWDSAVQIDSAGWVAEVRIPFSQMRF